MEDADRGLFGEPSHPRADLRKAARSRQVWSKPERRQVLKGEWM